MRARSVWVVSGIALTAALVVGVGLGTASAGSSDPCGAVTKKSTCEKGGGSFVGGLYQVPFTLPDSANESDTALCKGGPSLNSRDTALSDNLLEYLIASIGPDPATAISRIEDSRGRLVGYSASGDLAPASAEFNLYVTCIDDH